MGTPHAGSRPARYLFTDLARVLKAVGQDAPKQRPTLAVNLDHQLAPVK
jgi:hypothetical protein